MGTKLIGAIASCVIVFGVFAVLSTPAHAVESSNPAVGLFLVPKAGGGAQLSYQAPTNTASEKLNLLPAGCAYNGASNQGCSAMDLGAMPADAKFQFVADSGLNFWVSTSGQPVVVRGMSVALQRIPAGGTATTPMSFSYTSGSGNSSTQSLGARDQSGGALQSSTQIVLDGTPRKITLGVQRYAPTTVNPTDTLKLVLSSLSVTTVTSQGTIDVFVHYGASHKTGVIAPIRPVEGDFSGKLLGGRGVNVYFAENALAFTAPVGPEKSRGFGSAAHPTAPTELVWGEATVDEELKIAGDGVFSVNVQQAFSGNPTAAPRLAFHVKFYIGTKSFIGSTTVQAFTASLTTSAATAYRYVSTLPVAGETIPAGTKVKVGLFLYGSTAASDYQVLYNSPLRPSNVFLPVVGTAALPGSAPAITLSAAPLNATVYAGQNATFAITASNGGTGETKVDFLLVNATGTFEGAPNLTLAAGANATVNLTLTTDANTTVGTHNVSVIAAVAGVNVTNVSLVLVVDALPPGVILDDSGNPVSDNATAQNQTDTKDSGGGIPGFEAWGAVGVLSFVAVAWARRRRSS